MREEELQKRTLEIIQGDPTSLTREELLEALSVLVWAIKDAAKEIRRLTGIQDEVSKN